MLAAGSTLSPQETALRRSAARPLLQRAGGAWRRGQAAAGGTGACSPRERAGSYRGRATAQPMPGELRSEPATASNLFARSPAGLDAWRTPRHGLHTADRCCATAKVGVARPAAGWLEGPSAGRQRSVHRRLPLSAGSRRQRGRRSERRGVRRHGRSQLASSDLRAPVERRGDGEPRRRAGAVAARPLGLPSARRRRRHDASLTVRAQPRPRGAPPPLPHRAGPRAEGCPAATMWARRGRQADLLTARRAFARLARLSVR